MSLALALLIASAGTADARRKATSAERTAVARKFHAPAKCAIVYISTVDKHWASYHFDDATFKDPDCAKVAADGVAILQFRGSSWHMVTAGSSFSCPVRKVPARVVKDLRVDCVHVD